ncbi:hypothetical protein Dalk_3282 [Desulfatibacillum aliphaticivorans]|uniref:DUF11 domain-containing protein n=1 Tax=Desulfatibacillum aliphaticivorans TaxID=218208 RepID=B8FJ45_DESAL|nr:hypothetical protein [Desulfatibacillum aliphaticivorans]ACL04972.1 hypothetical protein Dalk_3282 [Desulfatibacillum aliphaticivorans]
MKPVKIIALALAVCMALGLGSAMAAYSLDLAVTSDGVTPKSAFLLGETVYMTISASNDAGAEEIAGAAFSLQYPADVLTGPAVDADGVAVDSSIVTSFSFSITKDSVTTDTHRQNTVVSGTVGTVYFAGAGISSTGTYPAQGADPELFTAKFTVRNDAVLGPFQVTLKPTELYNPDAGYGDASDASQTPEAVTVLVGANTPGSAEEFPVLLDTFAAQDYDLKTQSGWVISGTVTYTDTGYQTGTLNVAVFDTSDTTFSTPLGGSSYPWVAGQSQQAYTVEAPSNGTYYIGAYVDSDGDDVIDAAEAIGTYTDEVITIADGDDPTDRDFSIVDPKTGGVPDFYTAWAAGYGDIGGPNADYDKDGYSNLVEYGNGTDPTSQDAAGGTDYDADTDSRVAPWTVISGTSLTMDVDGTAMVDDVVATDGDWFGAFGPGGDADCRAVFQIGDGLTANVGAFDVTLVGDANDEIITYKLRQSNVNDSKSMATLDSEDTTTFASGTTESDVTIVFEATRTQQFTIITGWNWISFNVLPDDVTTLNAVLGSNLDSFSQIKTQTSSAIKFNGNWLGNQAIFDEINDGMMFLIESTADLTMEVTGAPIDTNQNITLLDGWTWISYLPDTCMTVETALASVVDNILQVKSQTQSKILFNGNLIGSLSQMCPSLGYIIEMDGADTLTYPAAK